MAGQPLIRDNGQGEIPYLNAFGIEFFTPVWFALQAQPCTEQHSDLNL